MPAAETTSLAMKNRRMTQALENVVEPRLEFDRMPTKNMQAAAGALINVRFPDGHPDKERFEFGMEHLKTAVVLQDNYALSRSHVGTSGGMGSTASRWTRKSSSQDQDLHRPSTHGVTPQQLYEPQVN